MGIYELKSHLSENLRLAEAGETICVMDRARPIARVVPMDTDAETVEIVPASATFRSVRKVRLPPAKLGVSSLDVLRLERGGL